MEIKKIDFWKIISYILLAIIILPIAYIFLNIFNKNSELTKHIFIFLLKDYIINTFKILIPTVVISSILGVFCSYFETFYEYTFRNFFKYACIISFAIPSYLFAYIYLDLFTNILTYNTNIYLDIANIQGAILILSISFYPYVYLTTRSAMKKIPMELIYTSKLLGKRNLNIFFNIVLPIIKNSLISGILLVIIETLNSFGVPSYFGIPVFSTGIYDAWINYYDIDGAIKLSFILILIVITFITVLNLGKKNIKYSGKKINIKREKLKGIKQIIVIVIFMTIFLVSFLIPILIIIRWLYISKNYIDYISIIEYTKTTLYVLISSSIIILILAIFFNSIHRNKNRKIFKNILSLAYAIPGSVISIGFLSIFLSIDHFLINNGYTNNLIIIKSNFLIILAYITRFLSIAYLPIENSIEKTGNSYHNSSRILGYSRLKTFFKVDFFMLKEAILSSFLLVSIEIIKEMPLAAMLLNKNTLAIQMKYYASDEELSFTAFPAIILLFFTITFIYIYNYLETKGDE